MNVFRRVSVALAVSSIAMTGCVTEVVNPTAIGVLQVEMPVSSVPLWTTVDVKFTNKGTIDVYLRPQCGAMKRKYGNEWRTPEALAPLMVCASTALTPRRLPPGQSIVEPIKVWSETPSNIDITGEFRLWYQFAESLEPQSPIYQTGTATFTVNSPQD